MNYELRITICINGLTILDLAANSSRPALRPPLSALCSPPSALRSLLFALRSPLSALRSLLFALCSPLSALRSPLSALCSPLSALLVLIIQNILREIIKSYPGFEKHRFGFLSRMVLLLTNDTLNTTIDDEHGAGTAWGHSYING
jgi:hypothetical protein